MAFDVVVVGSGPGGATVARALARAGKRVVVLEKGRDWRGNPFYGTYAGAMLYTEKGSFLYSREGINIIRPQLLGGATSMYCGCATPPSAWWRERYGIDLVAYADETIAEFGIAPLPPETRGVASTRLAAAGDALGMAWKPQPKFIFPERSLNFDCGAKCMLGCRCGAKWSAAEFIDDAVSAGAEVRMGAAVERVLVKDGTAVGVAGRGFEIRAKKVVLAAGGLGTPLILQRSGVTGAGEGLTLDTTFIVYGYAGEKGNGGEPPMTWVSADDDLGVLYSTLIDPWLMYPIIMLRKGPAYPLSWVRWGRTLGVMIKLKDDVSGRVDATGIRKGLTAGDRRRLAQAEKVARQMLVLAGCAPDSIATAPARGTHPSGTVRIGAVVDANLATEIDELYVCDASVFPEALARPTVLTIISLAKRLAERLIAANR